MEEYTQKISSVKDDVSVSVIVPVYNASSWLGECLDSLLQQSLSNIEIICVDDGSIDNSAEVLQRYARADARIRVITCEHGGAGAARNTALGVANGAYLAFLDADDFLDRYALEKAVRACENHEADVCMYGADTYDGTKFTEDNLALRGWEMPGFRPFSPHEVSSKIFNLGMTGPSNRLVRRNLVQENALMFQEITSCNDVFFSLAALAVARRITTVEEPLLHVRRGHQRSLASPVEEQALNAYRALIALRDFLRERNLYSVFAQSFENWALDFSVGMTQIFGGHLGIRLRQRLVDRGFEELGLLGHEEDPEYFYYPWRVRDMNRFLHASADVRKKSNTARSAAATIIIPCPAETLSQRFAVAVESAAMQDYPNVEVFVILDSKRDELVAKAQEFASDGVRIIDRNVYSSDAKAFSAALDSAVGEYLVVLKPDDFLDSRFLSTVIGQMREMKAGVGACSRNSFTHDLAGNIFPTGDRIFDWEDDYLAPIRVADDLSLFTRIDSSRGMVVEQSTLQAAGFVYGDGDGYDAIIDAWAAGCLAYAQTLAAVDMELWYSNQCPNHERRASECTSVFVSARDGLSDATLRAGINRRWVHRILTDAANLPQAQVAVYLDRARDVLTAEVNEARIMWGDIHPSDAVKLRELKHNRTQMIHRHQMCSLTVVCEVSGKPSSLAATLASLHSQSFTQSDVAGLDVICALPCGVSVPEVVQRYMAMDWRFRLVFLAADEDIIDAALSYARAPFIVFARSGDAFSADFLPRAVAQARRDNLDVLYGSNPMTNEAELLAGTLFRCAYLSASKLHTGTGLAKVDFLGQRALAFAGRTAVGESEGFTTPTLDATSLRPVTALRRDLAQLLEDIAPCDDEESEIAVKTSVLPSYMHAIAEAGVTAVQNESAVLAQESLQALFITDNSANSAMSSITTLVNRLAARPLNITEAHEWVSDYWRVRSEYLMRQLRDSIVK